MTAVGSGLVLLVSPNPAEATSRAFDLWLRDAGWNGEYAELRPPLIIKRWDTGSARLTRVNARRGANRMGGCIRVVPARGLARAGPIGRSRIGSLPIGFAGTTPTSSARSSARVSAVNGRLARTVCVKLICALVRILGLPRAAALATLEPLPSYGRCRVASCHRSISSPKYAMCAAHAGRWVRTGGRGPPATIDDWCRTERPVGDSRCVCFAGLPPVVTRQILFGVFNRSRRGAHTRLEILQRVVDFLREHKPQISSCSTPLKHRRSGPQPAEPF